MLDADKDPHKIGFDAISTLLVDRLWIPMWKFSAVHPLRKATRIYAVEESIPERVESYARKTAFDLRSKGGKRRRRGYRRWAFPKRLPSMRPPGESISIGNTHDPYVREPEGRSWAV